MIPGIHADPDEFIVTVIGERCEYAMLATGAVDRHGDLIVEIEDAPAGRWEAVAVHTRAGSTGAAFRDPHRTRQGDRLILTLDGPDWRTLQ